MKYAEKTTVSSDKSRAEIEKILSKYGAIGFMYGWNEHSAVIAFEMAGKRIKFELRLPDKNSPGIKKTNTGRLRAQKQIDEAFEQAIKQRWRALALVIKAKLESVESGISLFEEEFMSNIVLPNGQTVGNYMLPQIEKAYKNNTMPPLLPRL